MQEPFKMITFDRLMAFAIFIILSRVVLTLIVERMNMQHRRIENRRSMERIERETNYK